MLEKPERVLIAGGGIGGLAAAIALGRKHIHSEVLERSSFGEESGAGIQLGPNATRAIGELGVLDLIEPHAARPEAIVIRDGVSGRTLNAIPLGARIERRYGAPYLTLHRADLHAALHATAEGLSLVQLRPGFDISSAVAEGDAIGVRGTDGSEAGSSSLICADGLWSTLRPLVAPAARLSYTGATAWRALLSRETLPPLFAANQVGLWLGPRAHLVHYPVRGGRELNVVAVTEDGAALQGWNQEASATALRPAFARWSKEPRSLLEHAGQWRCWSLYRLDGSHRFARGRIALLGDAAHPVLPYLAQGAALAIEDAVTLATTLAASSGDPVSAFSRYADLRAARAARVQRLSRRFGRLYHLGGALRLARNGVLAWRSGEAALAGLDWLYGEAPA
jgi:2-polyprenyl-6-methoxyphenol hydroxylase-like FAD-dependent oxidoreductase